LPLPQRRDGSGYPAVQAAVHREEERALSFAVVPFLLKEMCRVTSDAVELIKLGLAILVLFT